MSKSNRSKVRRKVNRTSKKVAKKLSPMEIAAIGLGSIGVIGIGSELYRYIVDNKNEPNLNNVKSENMRSYKNSLIQEIEFVNILKENQKKHDQEISKIKEENRRSRLDYIKKIESMKEIIEYKEYIIETCKELLKKCYINDNNDNIKLELIKKFKNKFKDFNDLAKSQYYKTNDATMRNVTENVESLKKFIEIVKKYKEENKIHETYLVSVDRILEVYNLLS